MIIKIIFILAGIIGMVAIFYASWFWRALLIPMVLIIFADVVLGFFKKGTKK